MDGMGFPCMRGLHILVIWQYILGERNCGSHRRMEREDIHAITEVGYRYMVMEEVNGRMMDGMTVIRMICHF